MATRFDPALIQGIAGEIRSRWVGHRVGELVLCPGPREAWLTFPDSQPSERALGFLLHPARGFIVGADGGPTGAAADGTRRTVFRRLYLGGVEGPPDQRLLVLDIGPGMGPDGPRAPKFRLHVELHTNQWNAILTSARNERIDSVLWARTAGGRTLSPGATYLPPEGARKWSKAPPALGEWVDFVGRVPPADRRELLLRNVAWTSSLNVDWILGGAASGDGEPSELERSHQRYAVIRAGGDTPGAWLIGEDERTQPYPVPLGQTPRAVPGLLRAMESMARSTGALRSGPGADEHRAPPDDEETRQLERRLRSRIDTLSRRRAALERQIDGDSPETLRAAGHLLLARQAEVPRGAEVVSLPGFDGDPVEIRLDPTRDAVRNAESYYERARRRERAIRSIPARIEKAAASIRVLERALIELAESGATEALWKAAGGRPSGRDASVRGKAEEAPLPYRRYVSSGGLEIRVGRSARGNDDLTFRHSSPDDVWLHAREAAGAHVILRWGRRDQNPPQRDLAEAAVLAATFSEGRHSGLVAVDWTRRKYVRKPRKAAAGAVIPERVATLFVAPDSGLPSRLDPEP